MSPKEAHVTSLFISLLATSCGLHQVHSCLLTEQSQAPYPPTFTQAESTSSLAASGQEVSDALWWGSEGVLTE